MQKVAETMRKVALLQELIYLITSFKIMSEATSSSYRNHQRFKINLKYAHKYAMEYSSSEISCKFGFKMFFN